MGLKEWWARLTGADQPDEPAPEERTVPTEADIVAALGRVHTLAESGDVPPVVMSRLGRVDTTIRNTLPRMRNLGLGSVDAYSVMATATDYLPEAIGGYLRLPRDWADTRPIENGKSSLLLLIDQLDLLGATMDRIFDAVCRADAQALIVHGRFLQSKFGTASPLAPTIDTGPTDPAPQPRSSLDLDAPTPDHQEAP